MAVLVADRTVPAARSRRSAPPSQRLVLVAVALGLLFGAMTCAAGLAGGVGHSAIQSSDVETVGRTVAHAGHLAPKSASESHSTPAGDHGDHPGTTSMAGGHPGMACVVSVDLHVPEASSAVVSHSSDVPLVGMSTGCPADVDPPVPRFS